MNYRFWKRQDFFFCVRIKIDVVKEKCCLSELSYFSKCFNPFPNKPWLLLVYCTSLLKTLWEKEKLLVMSNFPFAHNVFHLFGKLSAIFIKFKIVVCQRFESGQALVFTCLLYKPFENTVGKGEITRNEQFLLCPQCFPPVWKTFCHFHQIKNCRLPTLWIWTSPNFYLSAVQAFWKHCGKRRNCS